MLPIKKKKRLKNSNFFHSSSKLFIAWLQRHISYSAHICLDEWRDVLKAPGTKKTTAFYSFEEGILHFAVALYCDWTEVLPQYLKIHLQWKYKERNASAVMLITCGFGILLSQRKDGGRIDWIWLSALPIDLHDVRACVRLTFFQL